MTAPRRDRVVTALKDPAHKDDRDHVDIIIALGMAKEGFDWIWCEHALTVGYRASLTEIVQIIGRATRDAPGKRRARFTNLIAEPDRRGSRDRSGERYAEGDRGEPAHGAGPRPAFEFTPKTPDSGPSEGSTTARAVTIPNKENVGFNEDSGQFQIEIKGLAEPKSHEAERICREDLNEVIRRLRAGQADHRARALRRRAGAPKS